MNSYEESNKSNNVERANDWVVDSNDLTFSVEDTYDDTIIGQYRIDENENKAIIVEPIGDTGRYEVQMDANGQIMVIDGDMSDAELLEKYHIYPDGTRPIDDDEE